MGLIDILTQYDAKKKAAHAAKTVKHGVSWNSALFPVARRSLTDEADLLSTCSVAGRR